MNRYGYLLSFIIPVLVVVGFYLGGWWNLLVLGFVFIIEPLLDAVGGVNRNSFEGERKKVEESADYYRFILYLWVLVQILILIWAVYIVSQGLLNHYYEWAGFVFGIGLVTGGIGITVAHELGHKKSKMDRFFSQFLLMTVGYMHFYIEHNQGHHRNVATMKDPATARKNESFYRFWFRTVFGSYFSAWRLEEKRLKRKGRRALSIHNRMIWYQLFQLLWVATLTLVFLPFSTAASWAIPVFLVGQSVVAFTLLELVNYVEHYGIMRKEISPGRYERVNPKHSWNASFKISNYFLFQLQRHSDHHCYASKPYQILKDYDESPQLPAGYPSMIIAALIPPFWFSVMNERLESWKKTTASRT